jgi:hypothetical protein
VPISADGERRYETTSDLLNNIVTHCLLIFPITNIILYIARRRLFTQIAFSILSFWWVFYIALIGYIGLQEGTDFSDWKPREYTTWPEADSALAFYEIGSLLLYLSIFLSFICRRTTFLKFISGVGLVCLQFILAWIYLFND